MENKLVTLYCVQCHNEERQSVKKCSKCDGMLETKYNIAEKEIRGHGSFFERFWAFLPIKFPSSINYDSELKSPTIRSKAIENIVGGPQLWLKNETVLPTKSTKDRMGAVVLPFLKERGINEFAMSSTGNSSTSIAYFAQFYRDMTIHIFVGKNFTNRLKVYSDNVIVHVVDGDFGNAGKEGINFAKSNNIHWEGGFFNPARRDGLKTVYLEAITDMGFSPDYYFQSVSSAMGVVGVNKAVDESHKLGLIQKKPSLFCVQQESCSPMVSAWNDKSIKIQDRHIVPEPVGIASAILRGNPTATYPILYKMVMESEGGFVSVTDYEIYRAKELLYETEGIWACEASSACLAGYIKALKLGLIPGDESKSVLINITGGDRNSFLLKR